MTDKQARFAAEFLTDGNATQAAIRAGYSPRTARQQGHRLLTNADICARIAEAARDRSERLAVDQDAIIRGLHREALGERTRPVVVDGRVVEVPDTTPAARVAAWLAIARIQGLLTDSVRVEHDVSEAVSRYLALVAEIIDRHAPDALGAIEADLRREGLRLADAAAP
jgi:phage terminase small subunit